MNGNPEPVERKVQLTGGSTYTISLPKEWATTNDVETGTPLVLYPGTDRLVALKRTAEHDDDAITVDVRGVDPEAMKKTLETAYVTGYDEITIESSTGLSAEQRRAARSTVNGLVGVEIQAVTEDSLLVHSLLDGTEVSLRQTVVQMQLTALSMHEDAIRAILENDDELARRVIDQDDDVDRLFALVSRQFHRGLAEFREIAQLDVDRPTAFAYYRMARQLERVADHAEKTAVVATRQHDAPPERFHEDLVSLGERSRGVLRAALEAGLDGGSIGDLQAVFVDRDSVVADVRALDRSLYDEDVPEPQLLASVLDSIERIAEYGANVAETGLQSALRTTGQ
ncbi:phosphate uptake regulator PhoU [Natranaeroarchaeum aerophilus]|uniref:AbrB/MazE/SpoVT family DNA-binding domain-containing protein n=1 Tax=Natranaeroarchaeum aerophilus TaxID=2917711 RepID=A0AAE3FPV0_9EURY|nr:phosphate uptake regulator PhoU [Natranaeroarchaeum aerophilus]MCL9812449.1 AbrB/MazE/SpoVT family DNA-binding domain-containing protein [Natranaeroarchaeum aerophilus]